MCDSVVVMKDGKVVESGPVADIVERPRMDYTRRLIASQPALMSPASFGAHTGGPILSLDNLSVHFPQSRGVGALLAGRARHVVRAVDGVSLCGAWRDPSASSARAVPARARSPAPSSGCAHPFRSIAFAGEPVAARRR